MACAMLLIRSQSDSRSPIHMTTSRRQSSKKSAIQAPKLPSALSAWALPNGALQEDETYADAKVEQEVLAGQAVRNLRFQRIQFKTVAFSQTDFAALRLLDVRFEACDFANAHWEQATGERIEWQRSQLIGFTAPESRWQDLTISGCNLQLSQFRFALFKNVQFIECDFTDADFYGADLTGARFHKCNLTKVEFSQAKLRSVDLRTSTLDDLRAGVQELTGAIVTPIQAAYLAGRLGLIVKHVDEPV
jgi:uncharacterized protein YjbI with pentapeptide repeats